MDNSGYEAMAALEKEENEELAETEESKKATVEIPRDEPEEEAEHEAESVDEVAAKDTEIAELKEKLLRVAADFENFRKRSRRESDEQRRYGVEPVVVALLPVKDNLDRALEHASDDDSVVEGIRMVAKQFDDVLETFGVRGFESVGEEFSPERHEAMGQLPSEDAEPNTVLQELEKGYTLHDRLIRPAKVIVAAS